MTLSATRDPDWLEAATLVGATRASAGGGAVGLVAPVSEDERPRTEASHSPPPTSTITATRTPNRSIVRCRSRSRTDGALRSAPSPGTGGCENGDQSRGWEGSRPRPRAVFHSGGRGGSGDSHGPASRSCRGASRGGSAWPGSRPGGRPSPNRIRGGGGPAGRNGPSVGDPPRPGASPGGDGGPAGRGCCPVCAGGSAGRGGGAACG